MEKGTIRWYKVNCSFYEQDFGIRLWKDIMDFMEKHIGFDIHITAQYSEPFSGVDAEYKDNHFIRLKS